MSNRHSKKYLCLHFTLLALCIVSENLVTALKCFEGSAENKVRAIKLEYKIFGFIRNFQSNSMRIASDDSWTLCVFSNSLDANSMPENKGGTLFGIGPDSEDLSPFEALLSIGQSSADPSYKILQICVLEVNVFSVNFSFFHCSLRNSKQYFSHLHKNFL